MGDCFAPLGLDGADTQTDRHTNGNGDSMNNSAQGGRVGENIFTNFNKFVRLP